MDWPTSERVGSFSQRGSLEDTGAGAMVRLYQQVVCFISNHFKTATEEVVLKGVLGETLHSKHTRVIQDVGAEPGGYRGQIFKRGAVYARRKCSHLYSHGDQLSQRTCCGSGLSRARNRVDTFWLAS